jgi:hypothetical protein
MHIFPFYYILFEFELFEINETFLTPFYLIEIVDEFLKYLFLCIHESHARSPQKSQKLIFIFVLDMSLRQH